MNPAIWILSATLVVPPSPPVQATSTPAWPDSRPITHLFQNLFTDVTHLPSKTSLEIAIAGGVGTGLISTVDHDVADWAGDAGDSSYTRVGDVLGSAAVQGGAALATYAIGRIAHRPAVTHVGGDLIRAQLVAGIITQPLKLGLDRTRPNGGSRSFPSGHTSASFATASVLAGHFGWKVSVPAYATASFIAWTRVRDRAHYASDTVFGATIGLIAGQTVTRGHRAWTVVPVKTPGGAAVWVVRTK